MHPFLIFTVEALALFALLWLAVSWGVYKGWRLGNAYTASRILYIRHLVRIGETPEAVAAYAAHEANGHEKARRKTTFFSALKPSELLGVLSSKREEEIWQKNVESLQLTIAKCAAIGPHITRFYRLTPEAVHSSPENNAD